MYRVLHKCIFKTLAYLYEARLSVPFFNLNFNQARFTVPFFIYLKARLSVPFFNSNFNQARLSVPFFNSNFNQFLIFIELVTESNTHQRTTLTTMSLSEPERTPNVPSSPIARKHRNSNAFPVTPSPTKDCGSKRPFVDNEPSSNAWKTSRTTPPSIESDR